MASITFEEFKTKGEDLLARLDIVKQLYDEANALVKSFDPREIFDGDIDEEADKIYEAVELANDIAYKGNYIFNELGARHGYWLPSLC